MILPTRNMIPHEFSPVESRQRIEGRHLITGRPIKRIEETNPKRILENAEYHLRDKMNWKRNPDLEDDTFQSILWIMEFREKHF